MSGIAALLAQRDTADDPNGNGAAARLLSGMLQRMGHRGPDGAATSTTVCGGLGQCTLVTTPEDENVSFPVKSRHGERWIVADARIDNRDELRTLLDLSTDEVGCDAALVLAAYERWGERCAEQLLGDFAFAILDHDNRRLYCARDPFGVKPLYYHLDRSRFCCASEANALFADKTIPRLPQLRSVALWIVAEHTDCGDTLYEGIRALPPGHYMTVTHEALRLERHWSPDPWRRLPAMSEADYDEALRWSFKQSVSCRLRSQRPFGVALSGGLDSSSVAGQIEALRRDGHGPAEPPVALHAEFPGLPFEESRHSDAVAEFWELPRINARPLDDPQLSRPHVMMAHPDVYYDPRWAMWFQLLRAAAARGIRTTFTGEGADLYMCRTGFEVADALRAGRLREAAREAGVTRAPASAESWRRLLHEGVLELLPERVRAVGRRRRRGQGTEQVLTPRFAGHVRAFRGAKRRTQLEHDGPDLVSRMLCATLKESSYFAIMALADRIAATHGAELRHPWLDRRIVELLLAVPHGQRYKNTGSLKSKPMTRRSLRGLVPEQVRTRSDATDLGWYISSVLFDQHFDKVLRLLNDSRLVEAGVITSQFVRDTKPTDDVDRIRWISNTVAMEIWLRQLSD